MVNCTNFNITHFHKFAVQHHISDNPNSRTQWETITLLMLYNITEEIKLLEHKLTKLTARAELISPSKRSKK